MISQNPIMARPVFFEIYLQFRPRRVIIVAANLKEERDMRSTQSAQRLEGTQVRNLRLNKGLSLRAFGERMGVSYEWVRQLETYDSISQKQTERICTAFHVDCADPLFFTEPQQTRHAAAEAANAEKQARQAQLTREKAEREALKPIRAAHMRSIRLEAGLSQLELAQTLGTTQTRISALEHGKNFISDDLMERIENAVSVAVKNATTAQKDTAAQQKDAAAQQKDAAPQRKKRKAPKEPGAPFISVFKAGIAISNGMMEKFGDKRHILMYIVPGGHKLAIMPVEAGRKGAKKLYPSSTWRIIGAGYRKAAEKMMGFKVGNGTYRVMGTWTLDEEYEYWLFDMSAAELVHRNGAAG